MIRNRIFYENLNVAIDLLANEFPEVNSNYKELANLINERFPLDFDGNVTERDIWIAFEPDISADELDLKLSYTTLFQENYLD